jgi:hypothetical protein
MKENILLFSFIPHPSSLLCSFSPTPELPRRPGACACSADAIQQVLLSDGGRIGHYNRGWSRLRRWIVEEGLGGSGFGCSLFYQSGQSIFGIHVTRFPVHLLEFAHPHHSLNPDVADLLIWDEEGPTIV